MKARHPSTTLLLLALAATACAGQATPVSPEELPTVSVEVSAATPTTATPAPVEAPTTTASPATTTSTTTEPPKYQRIEDLPYNDTETLDVYVPAGGAAEPVALLLHGGLGNPGRYAPLAEALASRGIVVMNVTWRSDAVRQETAAGVACAVRFARAHATDFGGDPENIMILGHSAGAAIGSVIALGGDLWNQDCPTTGVSALPNAFMGVAGPYDPTIMPGDDRSFIKNTDPETYEQLNPLNHIGRNSSLVFTLLHGDRDGIVPLESSTQFHDALLTAGHQGSLLILEDVGHEDPVAPASNVFATTVEAALAILNR